VKYTGDAHGWPSLSAVAMVMYRLLLMIALTTCSGVGSPLIATSFPIPCATAGSEIRQRDRRTIDGSDDVTVVSVSTADESTGAGLLALYDQALPDVYGYLVRRCGDRATAEDLTADVFMAAVDALRRPVAPQLTVGWLIGTARHKLVDHWRRAEREQRRLSAVAGANVDTAGDTGWDVHLDAVVARDVLTRLGAHHRTALVLRYLDDLSVPQVAEILGRTVHATEALLVRARIAFRSAYEAEQEVRS